MDAITFIRMYPTYLKEIKDRVKEEYYPVIEKMEEMDPHDLVTPEDFFINTSQAKGLIWCLFVTMSSQQ